jgi:hypothetical protein
VSTFFLKFFKIFIINTLLILSFVLVVELLFGYWFDKDNFGPYMREHRMKNQRTEWTHEKFKEVYFYRRNYHGFRGEDVEPKNIQGIILGASVIDERYKPEKYTITGFLNQNLKKNNYDLKIFNGGVEAQSAGGMILGFKHWLFKLDKFKPKIILLYVGLSDALMSENSNLENIKPDGHLLNPEAKEIFMDNIKSRSIFYDSARIFKFKFLPRKGYVKYDGNPSELYKEKYNFIKYDFAKNNYNLKNLNKINEKKIKNYLEKIDQIYLSSKKLNSKPVFVTNIDSKGHTKIIYSLNTSLMKHCEIKKYYCIDVAKNLKGEINYWWDGVHTTKKGSKAVADLIYVDLKKILDGS